jgi:hypothetical protein
MWIAGWSRPTDEVVPQLEPVRRRWSPIEELAEQPVPCGEGQLWTTFGADLSDRSYSWASPVSGPQPPTGAAAARIASRREAPLAGRPGFRRWCAWLPWAIHGRWIAGVTGSTWRLTEVKGLLQQRAIDWLLR